MNIGYSYWGFLADVKMNENFEELSTPDGNAFYSWSIIRELQKDGNVIALMPDRDKYAVQKLGESAFSAWASQDRFNAYSHLFHIDYNVDWKKVAMNEIFKLWDERNIDKLDYIIHEWRMSINGRNTIDVKHLDAWQPDLFLQSCLVRYCKLHKIKLFIFDLDYKLELSDAALWDAHVLELGNKWENARVPSSKVYIPFGFDHIDDFKLKTVYDRKNYLVYIGNRYERDWCIDKYIPEYLEGCVIHGNWKEAGRDSEERWPKLTFEKRLQLREMHEAYSNSVCTLLLAKEDYCKYSFMTARLVEAVFYGTVPLFIQEYGEETIKEFAGKYADILTVTNKTDVVDAIKYFRKYPEKYLEVITYLRQFLSKMDAKNFVKIIKEAL